jgi:(E)-4-hydroxy-3-methylbut-2-enyl-diphosphate synthase
VAYGHGGVGLLFKAGQIVKRMKAEELEDAVVDEALRIAAERAPSDAK